MLYKPREDSYMLAKHVQKEAKGNVLDVGTGSGIQAVTAAKKKSVKKVLAIDIQKSIINYCKTHIKSKKISFKQSNLFANIAKIPKNKFDTIIFNPPYLPGDVKLKDITVEGGKKGFEAIERFLNDVSKFMKPDGIILLLFSSLTKKDKVNEILANNLLEYRELGKKKMFFEELYIYRITKSALLKKLEKKRITDVKRFMKGHRGMIFTGIIEKKVKNKKKKSKAAIKVQRNDIGAKGTVDREAKILKLLNKHNIGPRIIFAGKDFFVYEFIEGIFIQGFLQKASKKDILKVIKDVFQQCHKLDKLKLNKEEMQHPYKHIIVGKKGNVIMAKLVDFERAKKAKKPHNVTQFCQYVSSGKVKNLTKGKLKVNKNNMINLAGIYKKNPTKKSLDNILRLLK